MDNAASVDLQAGQHACLLLPCLFLPRRNINMPHKSGVLTFSTVCGENHHCVPCRKRDVKRICACTIWSSLCCSHCGFQCINKNGYVTYRIVNMVQLACDCLNVKINLRETDLKSNIPDLPAECEDCDFFCSELAEAKICPTSVQQEHPYLVHKVQVKDWLVHRCVNCGVYTHAVPSTPGRRGVLVSKSLQSDPAALDRLTQSSDYSPLFRIILRGQDPNIPSNPLSEDSSNAFQSLQTYISGIQHQLNSYLLQEESNMEERIRVYEEEQRAIFSDLETRAKNDKKKMVSVLFNNMQTSSQESLSSLNGNKPVLRSTKSVPMTTSVNISPRLKGQERRSENSVSRPRSLTRPYDQSPDSEAMFMLDDEDEDTPFYVSDEEDTDDSIQMDDSRRSSSGNLNQVFSTSVPISVPVWKTRSPRKSELDDDHVQAPAPDQMAASMQALAKSVHNNDITDIFGELPRPRLNTFTGIPPSRRK